MRSRLDRALNALALFAVGRPFLTIVCSVALCLFFGWHIKELRLDTTTEGMLLSDDPWLTTYNEFLDRYGRDEMIIVSVEAPDIFTPEATDKIRRLHRRIENEVPYISRVDSLITARDTRGEADALIVGELFDGDPQTPKEYAEIKARALRNPFYINRIIDENATITAIIIRTQSRVSVAEATDDLDGFSQDLAEVRPLSDEQNSEIVKAISAIVSDEQSELTPLRLLGSPVVTDRLKRMMESDIRLFIKLLIAAIAIMLFAFFRRISGVVYPLIVVILSLFAMLGLLARLGIPIKLPTQVMPTLLLAIGVGACVHLLAVFYRAFDESGDKKAAVIKAARDCFFPIVMTSLTTIAGIGSFVTAKIDPFVDLGLFAPFGILISAVLTLTLLPALLVITPMKRRVRQDRPSVFDRFLIGVGNFSARYPKTIAATFALLLILSIALLTQARLSHYMMGWFPKDSDIRTTTALFDERMRGTVTIEATIDFGEPNALYDPSNARALEEAIAKAKEVDLIGTTIGVTTIIKEINRALNENDDDFYRLPDSRGAIAEELLLFSSSSSDDLNEIASYDYSQTRVTHKTPFLDAIEGEKIVERLEAIYKEAFPNAVVEITGLMPLVCRALSAAVESTAISYLAAIVAITAMMFFAFGSVKLGLFSMIPNLTPITIGMAYMVLTGVPFDMFVMLVGSIVLGLIVDDTIHFIYNFKRYYLERQNAAEAIRMTLLGVGRAMTITSVVLSVGFSVYLFAFMQNIVNFGLIAGVCIMLALIADFLLTPALLILWARRGKCEF
ncbi:MAG: MMPL family transporter [Helicobacteraceae bacterium]|jgi:predicted RND superfamily exporter protein|nr:MMPL family transporter [Helicobacteraceae bacterium]